MSVGFFKDVNKLGKMGREARATMPAPADMMAAANAQMASLTAQMNQQTASAAAVAADGVDGTATVHGGDPDRGAGQLQPGSAARAAGDRAREPAVPGVAGDGRRPDRPGPGAAGATVPVRVARSDRNLVQIDWARPL